MTRFDHVTIGCLALTVLGLLVAGMLTAVVLVLWLAIGS